MKMADIKFFLVKDGLYPDDSHGDIVMRAIEPLAGTGRGLPTGIRLSPKEEMAFDAGEIIFTS